MEHCDAVGGSPEAQPSVLSPIVKLIREENGQVGWIVLWLIGIPIPVLLALFVLRGCT